MADEGSSAAPPGGAITAQGLQELKAELSALESAGRQQMSERIHAARELGDLKENADYHIAKDDQAHLETKIKRLRERLRSAVVVDAETNDAALGFGRLAEILDETSGKLHSWTIVGPTEADLSKGKLSAESPVARALLGCALGESVDVETPGGKRRYRVERLLD